MHTPEPSQLNDRSNKGKGQRPRERY